MKKIILMFAMLTSAAFAAQHPMQSQDLEARVTALENRPITPSCNCAENGYGVSFMVQPLYWRVLQDGLDYAITASYDLTAESDGTTAFYRVNVRNGKSRSIDTEWSWGFRVGMGYNMPYDGWDLNLGYTRFHTSASDSVSTSGNPNPNSLLVATPANTIQGSGEFVSGFWVAKLFSDPGLMNKASASWKLDIDLIDLLLGREFYVSKALCLKPYVGLLNGWVDQKCDLHFLTYDFPDNPDQIQRRINVKMKNDFWGIGPKVGLNTTWKLGKGFSIFGNGGFALLDGHFDIRYRLRDEKPVRTLDAATGLATLSPIGTLPVLATADPYDDTFSAKKDVHTLVAMANLGLGLRWDISFSDDKYCFGIWLGYEQNVFFGQNRFMNPQYDFTLIELSSAVTNSGEGPNYFTDRGNLTTGGASGGIEFTF